MLYIIVGECILLLLKGTGTFSIVKAGVYKPKNGGSEVKCAIKALKPAHELADQKVAFFNQNTSHRLLL